MNKITTTTRNTARVLIAASALCAALVTGVRADEVGQVHVKYGDLNVTDNAGAATLYQRLKLAANEVCDAQGVRELARKMQARACVDRAIAQAVAAADIPALTGLYRSQVGGNTQLASVR